jgi:hypothetical protein
MRLRCLPALTLLASVAPCATTTHAADPGVTLVGVGKIPGTALDRPRLAGDSICKVDDPANCIDQATLGGFGLGPHLHRVQQRLPNSLVAGPNAASVCIDMPQNQTRPMNRPYF